jgi:hypothetical protein
VKRVTILLFCEAWKKFFKKRVILNVNCAFPQNKILTFAESKNRKEKKNWMGWVGGFNRQILHLHLIKTHKIFSLGNSKLLMMPDL